MSVIVEGRAKQESLQEKLGRKKKGNDEWNYVCWINAESCTDGYIYNHLQ